MLRFTFNIILSLAVLATVVFVAVALIIIPRLPDIETLRDVRMQVPLRVYTRDGSLISEYGEKRRIPVSIDDVPEQFVTAFIAAEDDRFFQHPGVDWQGIARAGINLIRTGEKSQGGSTITMQVARNFFLSREKSYLRKLNEIFLALKIERELSKNEILELYLNKIYLGQRAYGIGAAARIYYGEDVRRLSLPQMAMIAGLPKAPSTTNPVSNPQRALRRREYVLRRMRMLGYIDEQQFAAANSAPISASLHSPNIEVEAPYIAEMVRKRLHGEFGEDAYSHGYRVLTTIRDKNQVAANLALRRALRSYDERHGYRGAEHNFAQLQERVGEQDWESLLQPFPVVGSLYPALVTEVREDSIAAYLSGIGHVDIEWAGLQWARPYITENLRGPAPKTAADILKRGDVVRIVEDESGNWRLSQLPAVEGGLVSFDPNDGATLALVGGFDFSRSKFNRVVQAQRQPGSSFKPFVYSAALEAGFTAASVINDAPVVFQDPGIEDIWRPENYSGKYYGPTRLREALTHSRNLVSIRLLHAMGVPRALEHIGKFGFDTESLPHNLSLAIGSGAVTPWQLASAYTVLANGGFRVEPYFILRIETYAGDTVFAAQPKVVCRDCAEQEPLQKVPGKTDPETDAEQSFDEEASASASDEQVPGIHDSSQAPRVVNSQNIWIMNSLLQNVIRHGTGRGALRLQRADLAGKTGTTNDYRDAWFAGFNASVVAISWVGFDKFDPLGNRETGSRAALPMWIDYMRTALDGAPESLLPRPPGIVNVRIDKNSGALARSDDPDAIFEVFRVEYAPTSTGSKSGPDVFLSTDAETNVPEQLF